MADTLFAVDDAAQRLNLKPATLRLFIRQKRVQGVKIGRRVKVAQSELERILRQGIAANGAAQAPQAAPTLYPRAFPNGAQKQAQAIWQQMTSGKKGDHNAAILRLANAPAEVRAIVAQRSADAAAAYYATPEGRALDGEPFPDEEEAPDLAALFAPPTPEQIAARLKAWESFGGTASRSASAQPLTDDAVAQGYDERAAQLMEGHR